MNLNPCREKNESYDEYVVRRANGKKERDSYLKGRYVSGMFLGPYDVAREQYKQYLEFMRQQEILKQNAQSVDIEESESFSASDDTLTIKTD